MKNILWFKNRKRKLLGRKFVKDFADRHSTVIGIDLYKSKANITFCKVELQELFNAAIEIENSIELEKGGIIISFLDNEDKRIYAVSMNFTSRLLLPMEVVFTGNTVSGFKEFVKSFRVGGEYLDDNGGVVMWDGIKDGYFYLK